MSGSRLFSETPICNHTRVTDTPPSPSPTQSTKLPWDRQDLADGRANERGAVLTGRVRLGQPLPSCGNHTTTGHKPPAAGAPSCCRKEGWLCCSVKLLWFGLLLPQMFRPHSPASAEKTSSLDLPGPQKSAFNQILHLVPPKSREAYLPSILVNLQKS